MRMSDVQRAIEIVTESRRTHETWLAWYAAYPDREQEHAETCGDSGHHQKCIEGYNHVLDVLNTCLSERIATTTACKDAA
jgi:hypothetical protein